MRIKKAAIIGCGAISATHASALAGNSRAELVAFCDVKRERAEALAKKFSPEAGVFTDMRAMLKECPDIDTVHICTPHHLHAQMAVAAMRAGCDVYLEKPCAMNVDEAKSVIRVSGETEKKVCVSFQNRLIDTTLEAKRILASGRLGKLLGMKGIVTWDRGGAYYTESDWRGAWRTEGGGVLMNQSIHTLDLLYVFGGKVEKVEGTASLRKNRGVIEVEDTAEATLWFESGATAVFYATNCHVTTSPVELELVCEKGGLLIRNDTLYECRGSDVREVCKSDGTVVGKNVWGTGHVRMIDAFYRALDGEDAPYCDIRDAWQVLAIIEDIYRGSTRPAL